MSANMSDFNTPVSNATFESSLDSLFGSQSEPKKNISEYYTMNADFLDGHKMFIAPEPNAVADYFDYVDHPEAEVSDDEEDDNDMDFDLPQSAFNPLQSCSDQGLEQFNVSPQTQYDSQASFAPPLLPTLSLDFSQGGAYPQHTQLFGEYPAPIDSIDPTALQLSREQSPQPEQLTRFDMDTPLIVDDDQVYGQPSLTSSSLMTMDFGINPISLNATPAHGSPSTASTVIDRSNDWQSQSSVYSSSDDPSTPTYQEVSVEMPSRHFAPEDQDYAPGYGARAHVNARRKKITHGPHVCEIVLPSGELCSKAFTRPYDLSRHQETIHAAVRKTFTCDYCGERSKTFSRMDALSRHIRIKHSE